MEDSQIIPNFSRSEYKLLPQVEMRSENFDDKLKLDEVYTIPKSDKPSQCISFTHDDLIVSNVDGYNPQKLYYRPNKPITVLDFESTEFMESFDMFNFWAPVYITTNSINFKVQDEWYTLYTNGEYVLQIIVGFDKETTNLYFNNIEDGIFFKVVKGKYKSKPINTVYIPKPTQTSNKLIRYFIMDNYRFLQDQGGFYIKDIKDDLNFILDGLDYYYIGTSIKDHAKDIDIHIKKSDYKTAVDRLDKEGWFNRDYDYDFNGTVFGHPTIKNLKLDLLVSPYSKFQEPLEDDGHTADPLFMYFIQANLFCSINHDNLSSVYKEWRFNKLLETRKEFEIQRDSINTNKKHFKNTFIERDRFNIYFDLLNDNDYNVLNDDVTYGLNSDILHIKKNGVEYLIVYSKYLNQIVFVNLPFNITDVEGVDYDDVKNVTIKDEGETTQIRFQGVNNFATIKFSRINES